MQISEAVGGVPTPGAEPCRFPKLEECAHFHYERVQLPRPLEVALQTVMDQSLHSQHADDGVEWHMVQVTSGEECWLLQRSLENFRMLDFQLHQCIYDRKISQLPDLSALTEDEPVVEKILTQYLDRFTGIADNSVNCGPVLNWLQMDNRGHRLLVPSEESRSINTPAVAAAYSVRRYVSQARDELNLEVGDMISVIDMASPGESIWWRGKRGFQVGFFPQHCVHIIGDKVPRNMPLPPPVVGSLALSPIKPVLRKHGKLIAFFRSFILNRPSRRRLKQSGILRERVFGCDLGEHLLNSGHDIPTVLKCCAEFIESHGIVDGIYRLSGITSNIQKLRNAFDEDRIPNLYTEDILQDIHSVASLLKMYFRELPNPLCTYQLYRSFVGAVQGCNSASRNAESDRERLLKMREAVQKLPPPHYRTLEYLTRHLAKVAAHGPRTGMTTRNVAIVWAPNLLRCAELEVGGVAALQGVGIQAVVTEFLICYADLIFCDRLPNLDFPPTAAETCPSPRQRCRPKSLAISTPTKLITLEEARSKHMLSRADECGYIEVGGGPENLPKKYHTVIELPAGSRKRGLAKRSPSGWRSFFSKSRNGPAQQTKPRKASCSAGIVASDKFVTEPDLTDIKRKLRTVKSAESLTSGHSEPAANEVDVLGPLHSLCKPTGGHNRSVSHDSYFDTLQNSQNNSEGSLLDLSEIQLNFELEESEMRIFSEDESLVSSPRLHKEAQRRVLTRSRPEEFGSATNSSNPSPKKQARIVLSPDSTSRKRTRLEDQLSDIRYIDCNTPENVVSTTTAVIHTLPEPQKTPEITYRPKNKSPRNSDCERHSLNLERQPPRSQARNSLPKSSTATVANITGDFASPPPPSYERLTEESSGANSPGGFSPEYGAPVEIEYRKFGDEDYENVLTTISITYKSPTKSRAEDGYDEDVNAERAEVPREAAELPAQQASQPLFLEAGVGEVRPKSLSALDEFREVAVVRSNATSLGVLCDTALKTEQRPSSSESNTYNHYDLIINPETDLSLSEIVQSSTENLCETSVSTPISATPNVSPTEERASSVDLIDFSPDDDDDRSDKRKSSDDEMMMVYQQVKYFRRSVSEINALVDLEKGGKEVDGEEEEEVEVTKEAFDSLEVNGHEYENVMVGEGEVLVDSLEELDAERTVTVDGDDEAQSPTTTNATATDENVTPKAYDRESLPPCLRARNIRNQIKTRSLDEREFERELGLVGRRRSMDERKFGAGGTLPKALNEPKRLPEEPPEAHSHSESSAHGTTASSATEQQRRERIEKYKEERRKFLQDKYKSESFKEDKDVLLSRLKVFKVRDEKTPYDDDGEKQPEDSVTATTTATTLSPKTRIPRPTGRRKSSASSSDDCRTENAERTENGADEVPSIKSRTAMFESQFSRSNHRKDEEVAMRGISRCDRRTSLETEGEGVFKRGSLEAKKTTGAYCIKDMKAIFERKSSEQ